MRRLALVAVTVLLALAGCVVPDEEPTQGEYWILQVTGSVAEIDGHGDPAAPSHGCCCDPAIPTTFIAVDQRSLIVPDRVENVTIDAMQVVVWQRIEGVQPSMCPAATTFDPEGDAGTLVIRLPGDQAWSLPWTLVGGEMQVHGRLLPPGEARSFHDERPLGNHTLVSDLSVQLLGPWPKDAIERVEPKQGFGRSDATSGYWRPAQTASGL